MSCCKSSPQRNKVSKPVLLQRNCSRTIFILWLLCGRVVRMTMYDQKHHGTTERHCNLQVRIENQENFEAHHSAQNEKVQGNLRVKYISCQRGTILMCPGSLQTPQKQAIIPKKWRENFPTTKFALLFMAWMWIPHMCYY